MLLTEKVWVITGGAGGLGAAMAHHLARQGAHIALIDLQEAALSQVVTELMGYGVQARYYVTDITQEAAVEATFRQIQQDFTRLDGLVNNAGLMRDGLLIKVKAGELQQKMSLAQWQAVLEVNLTGSFLCGREAAAIMAVQGEGGVIVNISSVSRAGNMGQTNYSATKAGVAAMVVTWAKELARYHIRVAGIAPGVVATPMTAQMKPEAIERMLAGVPAGRFGTVEEIAHTLQYIIENDYVTGRIIEMDGGLRV